MSQVGVRVGNVPGLVECLERHPFVRILSGQAEAALEFEGSGRFRRIWVGRTELDLFGLVELMDNNPLVCADEFSLPSAASTLALVALGPLIRGGILAEPPTALLSFDSGEQDVEASLRRVGWDGGLTLSCEISELGSVRAGTFISVVETPLDPRDLDALYQEAYGSSFFVGRAEQGEWDVEAISGQPYALYRLRYAPDEPKSLLTVHLLADALGKCGASQIVHAFNVMAGFEESLGVTQG